MRKKTMFLAFLLAVALQLTESYKVGVGRGDCTGPVTEIVFMGYANPVQAGRGLHLRQWARAFIVEDNGERIVFVSVDSGMMAHAVRRDVITNLQKRYGTLYTKDNVAVSGTHTHSGPGGFLGYIMYDIPSRGFVRNTHNALVDGITNAIIRAHESMREARIFYAETEVHDANINRSPSSYLNNPTAERELYMYDVDKKLVQLRFVDTSGRTFGAFNWFAVHPTSMNNTNRLVSSDNQGYASILLESEYNPNALVGTGDFVGAFCSTNLGDVSPNTAGPVCEISRNQCDVLTSTCPKGEGDCFASGPGKDMMDSTRIIGTRIYEGASKLLRQQAGREVRGPILSIHQFVDMPKQKVVYNNTYTGEYKIVTGCLPAAGYSFAGGTTDGVGAFDFQQGTVTENAFWNLVRDALVAPTKEDKECHKPKPILLNAGRATWPYEWVPKIVPTQVFVLGDVVLAAIPGELTTMSGRRMRNTIRDAAKRASGMNVDVILLGLSNIYSQYIATTEEYQRQRYEAASTMFGPYTLVIYQQQYEKLTTAVFQREQLDAGPNPPHLDDKQLSLNPPVLADRPPIGKPYGTVVVKPNDTYLPGDTVEITFQAASPRNNHMHGGSFFYVERQMENGGWEMVANDAHWETWFYWTRTSTLGGTSEMTFYWAIPENTKPGTYRVTHHGYSKLPLSSPVPYSGQTDAFRVEAAPEGRPWFRPVSKFFQKEKQENFLKDLLAKKFGFVW